MEERIALWGFTEGKSVGELWVQYGGNLPAALCKLEAGETVLCQRGAMSWMDDGIEMQTEGGGLGKMFGRALNGEAMFLNRYVANRAGEIAFASSFPGEIRGIEITPQHSVIAQKRSFLASDESVEVSVYAQTKLGKGLLGGEGFLMQKFSGSGTVLIFIAGFPDPRLLGKLFSLTSVFVDNIVYEDEYQIAVHIL